MKIHFFFVLFLTASALLAQNDVEKKLRDEIWENADPAFKNSKVPDQWQNESAVILAMSLEYTGDLYKEKVHVHYRVKLLDKAAVSDYSELSFDKKYVGKIRSKAYSYVAAKIVKSDGKEREIDLTQAVHSDAGSANDLKIAVPDLEPGDIIDYFIALKDENYAASTFSQSEILEEKYPVVHRVIRYKLPQHLTFKSRSFNGAPEFKEVREDKEIAYTLEDKMREKSPDILWNFEHRSAPEVRYLISTSKNVENEKRNAIQALESFNYNPSDIGFIEDYMKGNFKGEKDPLKIVPELFYLLRNPIYMKAYYGTDQGNPMQTESAPDQFFLIMSKILLRYKIPHEILLIPGRHYGPLEDLVNLGSCDLALKINTTPPMFIPRPRAFSIPNQLEYLFEGMGKVSKKFGQAVSGIDDLPIPVSKPDDNITKTKLLLTLKADDKTKFHVERTVEASGHNKEYHQYLIFTNYDYLKEYDQPKYQVQSSSLLRGIIKDYNNEKKKFEQRLTQDYNERDKRLKDELEGEMDVKISDYKNLQVKNIGMWHTSPQTVYTDEFTIDNLTKKAGPNIIVEIGKLIEKQTFIKDAQLKRTRDVHMSYPRTYEYEMTLIIPEGFAAEGIENFNKKLENQNGGFVASAAIEGNSLVVRTKKYYTQNQYPSAEWPSIVSFLNPASDFNNAKLILKKTK